MLLLSLLCRLVKTYTASKAVLITTIGVGPYTLHDPALTANKYQGLKIKLKLYFVKLFKLGYDNQLTSLNDKYFFLYKFNSQFNLLTPIDCK